MKRVLVTGVGGFIGSHLLLGSPITILLYHSVNPRPDDYSITPRCFREHMELVKNNYPVIALKDIKSALANSSERRVIITFDDAFLDFVQHAYPVLAEFNMPATLFVPTGFVGRSNFWDSHMPNVKPKPVMDVHALRHISMDRLIDLGSHTVDHLRMQHLTHSNMQIQAAVSKRWLEDTIGKPVTMFSYPYGQKNDFSAVTERVLSDNGYAAAVTSCWGTRNSLRNLLALRRICFNGREELRVIRAMIDGHYDWKVFKDQFKFIFRSMSKWSQSTV